MTEYLKNASEVETYMKLCKQLLLLLFYQFREGENGRPAVLHTKKKMWIKSDKFEIVLAETTPQMHFSQFKTYGV